MPSGGGGGVAVAIVAGVKVGVETTGGVAVVMLSQPMSSKYGIAMIMHVRSWPAMRIPFSIRLCSHKPHRLEVQPERATSLAR